MTSRKPSFFEFWRRKKERGELLERATQLRLLPSQKRQLLCDSRVRAALQNTRMVSLLPPVGTEVFRRFTPASLDEIQQRHESAEKMKTEVAEKDRPKAANHLRAGKPLPFIYEDPPPELLNTPLEELDPFYQSQKTFVVLGKGNVIHRFNAEPACFLLSPFNPLRTFAIKILTHWLFSLFMLATILINCCFMMMSESPQWTHIAEYVFMAIFTFETMIKILSKGICIGHFTFLRDAWDWLDIMVVTTAYLFEFVDLGKAYVLTIIPRVLKLIPVIPGLKMTAGALVQSVKRLAGVIVLTMFCLSILALISMHLFMGALRQKCVQRVWLSSHNLTLDPDLHDYYDNETRSSIMEHYYLPGHLDPLLCGYTSDAGTCPEGFICMRVGRAPNYGYSSFDSFGWSLLAQFRLLTQDFWDNLLLLTLRAAGKAYLTFFVLVVFPGCFCVLSLILAVVATACGEREEAGVAEVKQREEEFNQILQVLKRSEEEEQAASRVEKQNDESMKTATEDRSSCPPCCLVFLRWDCCGCWRRLKQRLLAVITNPFFDFGIVVCLIVNIIFMAMEHYPMTEEFNCLLSLASLVFTAIFTAEMVLKLVALDPYGYFKVSWNVYDCVIVILNLFELGLADIEGLSMLRCFRLMRVFRLARWWPALHMFMRLVWTSVRALKNLILLLLIAVFLFAVVGMHLLGSDYRKCVCSISTDCELPRWHMSNFFSALLVIIRVLFGEWIEIMWDCMEVSGQATCVIFFMTVLFIGNLLVLNLFLTLLLRSFSNDNLAEKNNNVHNAASQIIRAVLWTKTWTLEHIWILLGKTNHVKPDHTGVDSKVNNGKEYLVLNFVSPDQPGSEVKTLDAPKVPIATAEVDIELKTPETEDEKKKHPEVQQKEDDEDDRGNTPEDCCSDKCYRCCPFLNIDTSQGRGRVWSNFRRACFCIVQHKSFEVFIIVIIVMSSTALIFEDVHLQHLPLLKAVVETADQVFTYLFLLEMLLKWIAFGLRKYFSNAWCWLDFLILDVSLVCLAANMLGFSVLGPVQSLRALGPLRAVSRFQGQRLVVEVLVRTIPSMINALLPCLLIWLFFSIIGINTFAGKFSYCFNETSEGYFHPEDVDNHTECWLLISHNYSEVRWKNPPLNFDSVNEAYLTLFLATASSAWFEVMYSMVDSREVESQPFYENNMYASLYIICFFSSSFFLFNFLIRFLIDELQKFGGKHVYMTAEQRINSRKLKKLFPRRPQRPGPRPQNQCQARLFDLVTHPYYEVFMVVVICLNMVMLMTQTDDDSYLKEYILHWLDFLFMIIFLTEVILKVIALRRHYFSDGWNIIDFMVIIISIVGLFLGDWLAHYIFSPTWFSVLRVGRISRVLHVIPFTRGIRKLLLALMMSLPALFNFSLLLFLLMVTFSIFGMFNFAYVVKAHMIDDNFNFETFGNSMIFLFMTSMGTGWDGLLMPIMSTPPDCDPFMENPGTTVQGNCGSPALGIFFFTTYIILSFLLVVHMFFAVILEVFNSEDTETLSDDNLEGFCKTWKKFDPDASQFIQYSKLSQFCDSLPDPMRIPKPNSIKLVHMDLPLFPGDKIHREDVLLALAAQVLDDPAELSGLKGRMEENHMSDSSRVSSEPISSTLRRKREEVAAAVIQRAYRKGVLQHGRGKDTMGSVDGEGSQ